MQIIHQVDAFTTEPFRGNPAGVCLLEVPADEAWMQNVASEMNLSETAFLHPEAGAWRLRWFTPTIEVELCGHATLAAAHIMWETGRLAPAAEARFLTRSGELRSRKSGAEITLDFPSLPIEPCAPPDGLLDAPGQTSAHFIGRSRFDYLVELASEIAVRELRPKFGALAGLPVRGTIVTSRATSSSYDFVSRFFAPAAGIDEDPVTGSAHCALAPYWAERLEKNPLVGYQASRRGGIVKVRLAGERVELTGSAVTLLRCELLAG